MPTTPPTDGDAAIRPRVCAAPPKCAALIAGNNAVGMPSAVALRSATSAPVSTWLRRMNRSESPSARNPGRDTVPRGGIGGSRPTPYSEAPKLTASTR